MFLRYNELELLIFIGKEKNMSEKKITSIGGQAVIEGVMMRGPFKTAVAVRKPDGEITIEEKPNKGYFWFC